MTKNNGFIYLRRILKTISGDFMGEQEKEASLPSKDNFSEWYNELLQIAKIMDVRYPVKGLYVWHPFGFTIRKKNIFYYEGTS